MICRILIMSVLLSVGGCTAASFGAPASECEALFEFGQIAGAQHWLYHQGASWTSGSDCCKFEGVTCVGGHVECIELVGINVTGRIDQACLGRLPGLRYLRINDNPTLEGSPMPDLSKNKALVEVDLR